MHRSRHARPGKRTSALRDRREAVGKPYRQIHRQRRVAGGGQARQIRPGPRRAAPRRVSAAMRLPPSPRTCAPDSSDRGGDLLRRERRQARRQIPPRRCSRRPRGGHRPTGWCRPCRSAWRGAVASSCSRPFHFGRHRRQDRIDIAAGFQTENGAAVVEQVEFDIAAAPDQLLLAIGRRPRRVEIAPHQFGIDLQEGAADVLGEGEVGIPVAGVVA